ncbi:phenol-soluble modulin export ABC transporter permease subunit PmtB [Staphylococcus equorum]|uniref:phenol-soluble modulin export ABC transporter permease subunit PmtB n=1 Tax=Staphylococcus equorum TaxID=246432 RepID=UPI002DBFA506|nr:ABC-2 transporter permease [Staphylococcus equorum]MEB7675315.1 ABC-2 transporter permease [Staphylococcus equorum]
MKNLLIRNLKLRKWTIVIYAMLLLLSPLQLIIIPNSIFTNALYSAVAMILLFVSILDSGHVFRFNSKLGHRMAYDFFGSLPVSKKSLLNANYLTVIIFTLVGAAILSFYTMPNSHVSTSNIDFNISMPFSYIAVNFFAVPIAFKKYTEQKSDYISYIIYLLTMVILIPVIIVLLVVGICTLFNYSLGILNYFETIFNYGFLTLSIFCFVASYIIQYKKLI